MEELTSMLQDVTQKIGDCINYIQQLESKDYPTEQIDFLFTLEEKLYDMTYYLSTTNADIQNNNNNKNESKQLQEDVKLTNSDKFLAHILNSVVADVQQKYNVTATADFTTGMTDPEDMDVTIKVKGNTLDLVDATSYLSAVLGRDDELEFTMEDTIKDNTVICKVTPR